jgi:hypothetical protein
MQLISVERWTFWSALVVAGVGPILETLVGPTITSGGTSETTLGFTAGPVFILILVSVALGGSRDPSVRSVPAQPQT